MSDIFLSYAREDRKMAHAVALALQRRGWSVWWDREILIGTAFETEIEKSLEAARCVVVLWSKHSAGSEWVRNEAGEGARRGVLVPARIDDVLPPLGYRGRQTADLTDWRGESDEDEFENLCVAVAATVGQPSAPPLSETSARPAQARLRGRRWRVVAPATALGMASVIITVLLVTSDDGGGGFSTTREVSVPGRAIWTDTGIDVQPGNAVDFEAAGEISGDVGATDQVGKKSGPAGIAGTANNRTYKNVIAEVEHAALIARIGLDGEPFVIRPGSRTVFESAGRLYLGINDTEPCNNGGTYTVVVEVANQEIAGVQPTPTTVPSCV